MTLRDELVGAGCGTVIAGKMPRRPISATSVDVVVSGTERSKGSDELRAAIATGPVAIIDRAANVWLLADAPADGEVAKVVVLADDDASVEEAQREVTDVVVAVLVGWFSITTLEDPFPEPPVKPRGRRGAADVPDAPVLADGEGDV